MQVETIRVKFDNDQGFCIINKDDFDAEKHELFDEVKNQEVAAEQEPVVVVPAWQK